MIGKRDLRNHLKDTNENEKPSPTRSIENDVQQDYALNEALNALKALTLRTKPAAPAASENKKG